jgi:hypothetical protein
MAKVAKKSASSAKKGAAPKKVAAKKVDKQKKAPAKVAAPASKKKAAVKPIAKKAAPAKKAVSKKAVVAKKATKPAVKKPVAKPVAKKAAVKAVVKKAKVAEKPAPKKGTAQVAKKAVDAVKAKAAPVSKKPAEKVAAKKVEAVKAVAPKAKVVDTKNAAIPVATSASPEKLAAKPRRKKKKDDDDDDEEEVVVFRKPVKSTKSAAKKLSSKHISEELTMEGPAPKRVGQINMTSDEKIKLKKSLLNKCIDIQKNTVSIAKKAMEDALTSANAEKVTEELSDSFRESMHATRDMYARQANEGVNNLGLLNRINIIEHDKVKFGSVVFTNFQNYFISTGLGEIKIDDLSFQAVSTLAPLFQILVDKRKGDTFMFLDRLYTVIEVF